MDSDYMLRQVQIASTGTDEQKLALARQVGYLVRAHLHLLFAMTADTSSAVKQEAVAWLEQIEAMAGDIPEAT